MIEAGVNYNFIATYFSKNKKGDEDVKAVGLEGASRTGKTYDAFIFICQYIDKYEGKVVVIARDTLASLKDTTYETLKKVWSSFGYSMKVFNKSATDIEYKGNTIKFTGVNDDLERTKGFESDLLYINEALSVSHEGFKQLRMRCTGFLIYDYNPAANMHYLFDLEKREDYRLLKTVIFDNPHAPINSVNEILGFAHPDVDDYDFVKEKPEFKKRFVNRKEWEAFKLKNVELGTADKFSWEVYGLGKRAVSEALVFNELFRYDEEPEHYDWIVYGGDFGYKVDPTSLVRITKAGRNIYIKQLIHETGLLNPDIARIMHANGWNDQISCWDKAEQKSIAELRQAGINAFGPKKVHIAWGIQKLQQFNIHIHIESKEAYEEFSTYAYLKLKNGEFKKNTRGHRIAKDENNHSIDASRYAMTYYYLSEAQEHAIE